MQYAYSVAARPTAQWCAMSSYRGGLATYLSAYVDSAVGNGAGGFDQGKAAIGRRLAHDRRSLSRVRRAADDSRRNRRGEVAGAASCRFSVNRGYALRTG